MRSRPAHGQWEGAEGKEESSAAGEKSRATGFTSLHNTQPESTDGLVMHSGTELLGIYFPGPE